MDWHPIIVKNGNYQAEWSPDPGMNLRIRNKDGQWHYSKCSKAEYASSIVEQFVAKRKKENDCARKMGSIRT